MVIKEDTSKNLLLTNQRPLTVQEVTEERVVDVWLNRWQCIFSHDTGMFYISFLIVSPNPSLWSLAASTHFTRLSGV